MKLSIRRCLVEDAGKLALLARQTFFDTFTGTCTDEDMQSFLDSFYNETILSKELQTPGDYTFFAEVDGKPVAYLRFIEQEPSFPTAPHIKGLELNRLYVDKNFIGTGVAAQLMDFYKEYAADNNFDLMWLGVWEHNYRAQAFYQKHGFRFSGYKHPFPIGNTPQTDEWWILETDFNKNQNEKSGAISE